MAMHAEPDLQTEIWAKNQYFLVQQTVVYHIVKCKAVAFLWYY